eukprot:TRINITY_DN20158_c0_g1_i1.p1 TRINITY_DN20158_c0_g1~~TRINITY_DN20158_c0_g1_i1.p1  ORF type:complete len:550 (+),score=85.60 TRINITY_DN20158_c0_g1_i1:33-1652(+)
MQVSPRSPSLPIARSMREAVNGFDPDSQDNRCLAMTSDDGSVASYSTQSEDRDVGIFDRVANFADRLVGEKYTAALHYYDVPKYVRLKAAPLQIPKIAFMAIGLCGAAGWIIYYLHFLQYSEVVSSTSVVTLSFPQKNFDVCHDLDIDCDDVGKVAAPTPAYCSNASFVKFQNLAHQYFFEDHHDDSGKVVHAYSRARWQETPSIDVRCQRFDDIDVWRPSKEGYLLASSLTSIRQERCPGEECIWKNKDFQVDFVFDVERFFFKLRHHVQTTTGQVFKNFDGAAFMLINGSKHIVLCDAEKEASGACTIELDSWKRDYPSCGGKSGKKDCFSTGWADFISMDMLLEAAGISLEDGISGGLPRRWWGTAVELNIEYSNAHPGDFWFHWPWTTHLQYTYSVTKLDDYVWGSKAEYENTYVREKDINLENVHGNARRVVRLSGLTVVVNIHGQLATFNVAHFTSLFAVFSIIFSMAVLFVDAFVLFLYKRTHFFKHLPVMHEFFQYDETPHHDHLRGVDFQNFKATTTSAILQDASEHKTA